MLTKIDKDPSEYNWYLALGNGGHTFVSSHGILYPEPLDRDPDTTEVRGRLPFVLREPHSDLPADRRKNYADRRVEVHAGVSYVAYYLRRFSLDDTGIQVPCHLNEEEVQDLLKVFEVKNLPEKDQIVSEVALYRSEKVIPSEGYVPTHISHAFYAAIHLKKEKCLHLNFGFMGADVY